MDHLPNRNLQLYQYVLELFPIWIVVHYISMWRGLDSSLISYIVVAVTAYLISYYSFKKMGKSFLIIAVPVVAGMAFLLGFDPVLVIILTAVLIGRLENRLLKPDQENDEVIFTVTLILSLLASILADNTNDFLIIAVVFMFTFFLGRYVLYYFSDPEGVGSVGSKKTIWFLSIGVVLFFSTYLFTFLYPYIRWVLNYVVFGVLYGLAWLVSPIVQLADYIPISPPDPMEIEGGGHAGGEMETRESDESIFAQYFEYFLFGIGAIVGLLILYLIYRYRKNLPPKEDTESIEQPIEYAKNKTAEQRLWKSEREKRPKNAIRKAYYQLEKWAADQEHGRYQDETVEEWLDRQQIQGQPRTDVLNIYQAVRYGEQEENMNLQTFKESIDEIKQTLKQRKQRN